VGEGMEGGRSMTRHKAKVVVTRSVMPTLFWPPVVSLTGNCPWCCTDGHAFEAMTEFFTDTERLDKIEPGWYESGQDN